MPERSQALQIVTFAAYTTPNRDLLIPAPQHGAVLFNMTLRQPQIFIFNTDAELNAWESFLHYYNASADPANNEVPVWNNSNKRWELSGLPMAHGLLSATHLDTQPFGPTITLGSIIQGDTGNVWTELSRATVDVDELFALVCENSSTRVSWLKILDTVSNPEDVAAVAAQGTSLVVPHIDHVHAHPASQHAAGGEMALFSPHTYVFVADADLDDDVATGDNQMGHFHHSYDAAETVKRIITEFETAPTGQAATIQLEYGDTDDLDTVSSWTEIDAVSHADGAKTIITTTFTNASIPANRLIRMNVDQVGSTVAGKNLTVHMQVLRPLVIG